MKNILLFTFLFIFLTGCSIDWNNENSKKIEELERKVNDINFEKNKECLKYKNEIQLVIDDMLKIWKKQQEIYWRDDYIHDEKLMDIIYSPEKNSCLYITRVTEEYLEDWFIAKWICISYNIHDFMTSSKRDLVESINWTYKNIDWKTAKECDSSEVNQKYLERLKKLKW